MSIATGFSKGNLQRRVCRVDRRISLARPTADAGKKSSIFGANYLLACLLVFGYIFAKSALYVRLPQAALECDFQRNIWRKVTGVNSGLQGSVVREVED
jgi:hypothetical protein